MEKKDKVVCEKERAHKRALFLLEYRDYSKKELLKKLKTTYDDSIAEYTVNKMEDLGLINDYKYAKKLLEFYMSKKFFFGERLKYEMINKGVSKETVDNLIEEIYVDPKDAIMQFINHKYKGYQDDPAQKRRAISALKRLGYSWENIKEVFREEF